MSRPITDLLDDADRLLSSAGQHPEKDGAFRQSAIAQASGLVRAGLVSVRDQIDRIGRLADKADNYLGALALPLSANIHVEGCKAAFEEIKAEAQSLYRELGGEELNEGGVRS